MDAQTSEPQSLNYRIEKLEAQNRRFKILGWVSLSLIVAASLLVMGQAKPGRTLETGRFILRDTAGRVRAEISMDQSGTPALTFYDEAGKRRSDFRAGELTLLENDESTQMNAEGLTVNKKDGHLDIGTVGLQFKATSTTDSGGNTGYASFGLAPSFGRLDIGILSPALTLVGTEGGFARLDTADGAHLHLDPGRGDYGNLLDGGFVDITSKGPLMQIKDQLGVAAAIGSIEVKQKNSGRKLWTPTASVVLTDNDEIRWSAPN